jgi:hypothetical protein
MRLERGALEKKLIVIPRDPLELVDLLPPVLAYTVLLVLRLVLRVRVAKIAAVHSDQRRGTKRQRLEDNAEANLPFLELTLLPHRLQDESKTDWLLVSLHPQDEINQIRSLMLPVLSRKKKRVRTSQLIQWQ